MFYFFHHLNHLLNKKSNSFLINHRIKLDLKLHIRKQIGHGLQKNKLKAKMPFFETPALTRIVLETSNVVKSV
jgi:hypothetical protein